MLFANCHLHSTFSDGVYTPEELVELAAQLGHKALILTDHDTVKGTYRLQKAARKKGLLSILGCEFSTVGLGTSFHLCGFDFNPDDPDMKKLLERVSLKQTSRSKLLYQWGLEEGTVRGNVDWQEVLDFFPENDYFCNNQVFDTLVAKGVYTRDEYFSFLRPAFSYSVPGREKKIAEITGLHDPNIEDVVNIIRKAGGVPVVAHPVKKIKYVDELLKMGVMGFETIYPDLSEEEAAYFSELCDEKGLYKMGGTDHYSVLGGVAGRVPGNDIPPDTGGVTEEDFMKIYRRELG